MSASEITKVAIEQRFFTAAGGQPPTEEQRFAVQHIGEAVNALALAITEMTPANRNQAIALTALEDVQMRANRAIFAKGGSA